MKTQEMALRNEIRQMMNEAGINRETIKQMVKDLLCEVISSQTAQALNETNIENMVMKYIKNNAQYWVNSVVKDQIFDGLRYGVHDSKVDISINVVPKEGE